MRKKNKFWDLDKSQDYKENFEYLESTENSELSHSKNVLALVKIAIL